MAECRQQRYLCYDTLPFHAIFRMLSAPLKKEETPFIFKLIELIWFSQGRKFLRRRSVSGAEELSCWPAASLGTAGRSMGLWVSPASCGCLPDTERPNLPLESSEMQSERQRVCPTARRVEKTECGKKTALRAEYLALEIQHILQLGFISTWAFAALYHKCAQRASFMFFVSKVRFSSRFHL